MRTIKILSAVILSVLILSAPAWAWGKKCPQGQSWNKTLNDCVPNPANFDALKTARENTLESRTYPTYTPGTDSPFSNDLGNSLPNTTYSMDTTGTSE